MAQGASVDLSKSQLEIVGQLIRAMAGRSGVSWLIWPPARASMQFNGLDDLDLIQTVRGLAVIRAEAWGDSVRYVGVGRDIDGNLLEVKCSAHGELLVVEVFAFGYA